MNLSQHWDVAPCWLLHKVKQRSLGHSKLKNRIRSVRGRKWEWHKPYETLRSWVIHTQISEWAPRLLKKIPANVTQRQNPSCTNLASSIVLSKTVVAAKGLGEQKRTSLLRWGWIHVTTGGGSHCCFLQPPKTGTQQLPPTQASGLNWPYRGNLLYHKLLPVHAL